MIHSAIIVDNEEDAIAALSNTLLTAFGEEIKIIATTSELTEAAFLIKEYQPDLIFLDIVLGKNSSGFDLLPLIEAINYPYKIIFSTGYHQFAIKAIKKGAYDYLLKPVGLDDLIALKNRLNQEQKIANKQQLNDIIIINNSDATYKVVVDQISHIKGEGNYTSLFFKEKTKTILTSVTLTSFEQEIEGVSSSFFRPHKSFLVNLSAIDYIKKNGINKTLIMKNGEVIPISRLKYKAFAARYFQGKSN